MLLQVCSSGRNQWHEDTEQTLFSSFFYFPLGREEEKGIIL